MAGTSAPHHVRQHKAAEQRTEPATAAPPSDQALDGEATEKLAAALDQALDHHLGPLDEAAALNRELKRLGVRHRAR